MRPRSWVLACVACAVAVGGCDRETTPAAADAAMTALADTAGGLADIRSATVSAELVAESPDMGDDARLGFRLDGALHLPEEAGDLPTAQLEYTQIAGAEEGDATFVAVDGQLYVTSGDITVEVPPERAADFARREDDDVGLSELRVDEWIVAPSLDEDDDVATISGELDVAAFYGSLSELSGGALPALDDEDVAALEGAVETSEIVITTGTEDRLLRAVVIDVAFGPAAPDDVPGLAPGVTVHFEVTLDDINEPVAVEAPTDAVPLDDVVTESPG